MNILLRIIGQILYQKKIFQYITKCFNNSVFFRFVINVTIATLISIICSVLLLKQSHFLDIDEVKHSQKIASTRLWVENIVDEICKNQQECQTFGRSFFFQLNKKSGSWCLGHRNMKFDKDYFSKRAIHIDDNCRNFLQYNIDLSISYEMLSSKCYDLANKCLFYDNMLFQNYKTIILCKKENNNQNNISCVSLVSKNDLDFHLKKLGEFLLNDNLSFFGD